MTNLIIGVDGGQTSTKCVLVDDRMNVLGYGAGGELRHLVAHGGRERHVSALRACIAQAFAQAGLPIQPVAAIGLGLSGVSGPESPLAEMAREYMPDVIDAKVVVVESDAYTALLGAHGGKPGAIAIAGTGSNAMGINAAGQVKRAGGWGWLLGDEGSAMRIGHDGLVAALQYWDRIGEPTTMLKAFQTHFNAINMRLIVASVYSADFWAKGFATLAEVVSRCATDGDAIARNVIEQNGAELARQVDAVVRQLAHPSPLPVSPMGGAFEHVFGLRAAFDGALVRLGSPCVVTPPQAPPMFGAAILANLSR
ncbi:MAG TPA: BadF/BadG/BcrA/BcrD ATPase family protein [Thermoflexales bacterium]|nr:BadF/BadG/BcrA/BcrD ATPase family protein [Thermoflexales bacterium]HQW33981.1 BadF/BadG/BcrA/BcrD ATPase family protein [Thermoflexales bacterium]